MRYVSQRVCVQMIFVLNIVLKLCRVCAACFMAYVRCKNEVGGEGVILVNGWVG